MNLGIDLGNSFAKVGIFDSNKLVNVFIINVNELHKLKEIIPTENYETAIVSSVINTPTALIAILKQICNKILFLDKKTKTPIINKYKSKETLGNDRLALASGCSALFKGKNVLIIDAGSCITYDFVDKSSVYFGGAISPGIEMRFKALNTFTAKLPLIEIESSNKIIGRDTKESILSGVINGVTFEVNSVINNYKKKYNPIKIIITGGDAIFLAKKIKSRIFVEPNFLLISLNQILLYNE
jgi:type III pantothenate kinase